ncbi:MAG TPA: ABC transporter permease [Candidatus Angelobacter sp.]|nr:ABC transporter permease [Candidatus Angelobacter sp.]
MTDWLRQSLYRLRSFFRSAQDDYELDAEMSAHLQFAAEENLQRGLPPAEARRQALIQFGGPQRSKEQHREARGLPFLETLLQDFRFAIRVLRKSPGFTTVAVLTLALGIGANTGIFTILREVLLQSLPVPHPQELVLLYSPGPHHGHVSSDESGTDGAESFSYPMYLNLRDRNQVLKGLAAKDTASVSLTFRKNTERAQADVVSGNYFQTLRVNAAIGRTFEPADTAAPGGSPVVMLVYGYWKSRFGGDPGVLNQTVLVNERPMTVVGVVQPGFDGIQRGFVPQLYVPITMPLTSVPTGLEDHKNYWIKLIGRLQPGMSKEQATAGLAPLYSALLRDELPLFPGWSDKDKSQFLAKKLILHDGAQGRPMLQASAGPQLIALMCLVGAVLFIACANVAGLLTARGAARQREFGIRFSLGASRGRIIRQLVVESFLLAVTGAILGLSIASWTSSALVHFAADNGIADGLSSALSAPVLGFTSALALLCSVLFGLAPALRATRVELSSTLKEQSGALSSGLTHTRLRKALVVMQVALALLLVTSAGGFARSLYNVRHINLGLRPTHILQFRVAPQLNGYDQARSFAFFHNLEDRLAALPGILSLSSALEPLISDSDRSSNVTVEGEPPALAGSRDAMRNAIGPGHFSNLGIPLLKGREFTRADGTDSPKVAVVNETFAKTFFPKGDPLGRHMKFGGASGPLNLEIIAVVKDSHHTDVKEEMRPFVYIPYSQEKDVGALTFYLRTSQDPATLAATVHQVVAELDSSLPIVDLRSFEQQIDRQLAGDRLIATLAGIFGTLAALLAAIGIYGLLAYTVAQRTREIGVRMALGANAQRVGGLILKDVAMLMGIGVVVGLPLAYAVGRLIDSLLYGAKAFELPGVAGALAAVLLVAAAATYFPARRATRIDPLVALRYE